MRIIDDTHSLRKHIFQLKQGLKTIGFVPTMGALHSGHLKLVEQSVKDNDITVVSIFVNPTQFNNADDLEKYPRSLEADVALLEQLSNQIIIFSPMADDLYNQAVISKTYDFGSLAEVMEGKFRPGHFDGVGTVLDKLFTVVEPDRAYFGEKDFQQLQIVKRMVAIEELPVQIIGCPIHRESSGLAMSSRNKRLNEVQYAEASLLYKSLQEAKNLFGIENAIGIKERINQLFGQSEVLELEYFEIVLEETLQPVTEIVTQQKHRAFIAAFAGDVRLIDNIALN